MTTVRGSVALTCSGCPSTLIEDASGLAVRGSYSALNENSTSSAEKGTPSDQVTPSRNVSVNVRLSGEATHFSASHGSTS
jgi:hypothetical protein